MVLSFDRSKSVPAAGIGSIETSSNLIDWSTSGNNVEVLEIRSISGSPGKERIVSSIPTGETDQKDELFIRIAVKVPTD